MPGIITITFSPCIDKSTSVPLLLPEKKLKCSPVKLEPGGGGINVARAIRKLGGEATAVYLSGGYTGKFFNKLMQQEGVPSIIIETENETRENIIVLEESANRQYRFGMPGTEVKKEEWQQCLDVIGKIQNAEFIVASGSLPPGVPLDIFGRIAVITKKNNAKFVVDTSGQALKYAAEQGVYLLKPNLGELAFLTGREKINTEEIESIAKEVIAKGSCEVIAVSMGRLGAVLVTKNKSFRAVPPDVPAKSTVGAGDSMVAGIIFALSKGARLESAIQYGVACGTAATLNPGTELCRKEDADRIFNLISCAAK